ncbi:hypothetical protein [Chloracidobacterium aggregatum]|uniref:Uncharacterized protein n=1 Tax=Chloracidobacterium sp. N TaxID=2821540 RepID=A0ABX8AZN9_9BACT|nr:hypothetical protein [Chloracidobacterium aggregatum]QUV83773.1 hypothetical protein J8C03_06255 [Chloracidobacterium sp. 2]QUV87747.1 hypothetical protein J8C07_11410 [Chloracidobacterium sp. S]QUV90646.1 hypothetical protein J8C04_10410 [Chloracidobacterium sp. A]QUV93860.1 hypothetical protein J8C05_10950 [Chloracidobacterium sp. N]QUV97050.1 hypothetical protein J8C00_00875 [Chloracidobacterium sp. E]
MMVSKDIFGRTERSGYKLDAWLHAIHVAALRQMTMRKHADFGFIFQPIRYAAAQMQGTSHLPCGAAGPGHGAEQAKARKFFNESIEKTSRLALASRHRQYPAVGVTNAGSITVPGFCHFWRLNFPE